MKKKIQGEQNRQEDQALVRGMMWVVGAVVLEGLLFLTKKTPHSSVRRLFTDVLIGLFAITSCKLFHPHYLGTYCRE